MHDDAVSTKDKAAAIAGGTAIGAAVGGVAYRSSSKNFAREILNPHSSFHEYYDLAKEVISQEGDLVDRLIQQQHGKPKRPYVRMAERIVKDAERVIDARDAVLETPEYAAAEKKVMVSPAYTRTEEAQRALKVLAEEPGNIQHVLFTHHQGVPVMQVQTREYTGPLKFDAHSQIAGFDVHEAELLTVPHVKLPKDLATYAGSAGHKLAEHQLEGLAETEWFQGIAKKVAGKQLDHYVEAFRKAAPAGWSWGEMGAKRRFGVITAAIVGAVCGVSLVKDIIVSRKHTGQLAADRQQAAHAPADQGRS